MRTALIFVALLALYSARAETPIEEEGPDIVVKFLTGFLEGLNEKGDVNKLLHCIKDIDQIIANIIKAIELIATKKLDKIIEGVTLLIETIKTLLNKIKPCAEGFTQIKKLIEAFKKIDIVKIALKILSNPGTFLQDIKMAINGFKTKDYRTAGKGIGNLLFKLFLANCPEPVLEIVVSEVFGIIKGFFGGKGLNKDGKMPNLDNCASEFAQVESKIEEIITIIKTITSKDLEEIIKAIKTIIETLKEITNSLIPCSKVGTDVTYFINIVKAIDFNKLLNKLLLNIVDLIHDITHAVKLLKEGKYEDFGGNIGSLIHTILLKQ